MSNKKYKKDDIIVVCSRNHYEPIKVIEVECDNCGAQIYLSDSSITTIKAQVPDIDLIKTPPIPICMECWMDGVTEEDQFLPIHESQITDFLNGIQNGDED